MPIMVIYLCIIALAYLLGSIPFGLIFTRLAGLGDIRAVGSGNIGATNVLRTGKKSLAALTVICDILKGTVAVWLAYFCTQSEMGVSSQIMAWAGLAALLGHTFPIWLKFKGGKGVASFIGVLIGLNWPAAVLFLLIWLAVAVLTRYSSLAALCATAAMPFFIGLTNSLQLALFVFIMSAIIFIKHKTNIDRLIHHNESKIIVKKHDSAPEKPKSNR